MSRPGPDNKNAILIALIGCSGVVLAAIIGAIVTLYVSTNPGKSDGVNVNENVGKNQNVTTYSPTPTSTAKPTLTPTPTQPEPAFIANDFSSWAKLIDGMQWRIKAIQRYERLTRFYLEIRNTDEQSDRSFYAFNKFPLVVIDDNGNYYKMLGNGDLPEGVSEIGEGWHVQSMRTITLTIDFAPLTSGKVSGHIIYRDGNKAEPAKFSFTQ